MDAEQLEINIGTPQLEWEVDEYPAHQRSRLWYIIASILGVALILYAVATANFLFAVIILMVGIITLISSFVPPDRVPVIITNTGVVVADMYYDFQTIKDFSIAYDPPDVKYLYFEFHSPWHPLLTVPLEDMDPNEVRELLLPYCLENLQRIEEHLTDTVRRLYKL
jgi:hypothetical protein